MKDNQPNINRLGKGIYTDCNPIEQPKATYRFGLNGVNESLDGDETISTNEEGNKISTEFPEGYTPIGKTYMSNGRNAIILCKNDNTLSEIGIVDENGIYKTYVNWNLGFNLEYPVDMTYRLRRGCEDTIYYTDGLNKPGLFNFNSPKDFKKSNSSNSVYEDWVKDKFNIFKTYNKTPSFDKIEIENTGNLPPGSYNATIQLLDEDLNPTEFITVTDTIIIYNDNEKTKNYADVRGSSAKETFYQNFGKTNKAIKFTIGNLDTNFPYYRIGIIEANNGSGNISKVVYSQEISTQVQTYIYTGDNGFTEGTIENIKQFANYIDTAEHIDQIDNRLLLANTKGKQNDYCELQKYASKIKADLILETVILNDIKPENNPKRPNLHNEKLGYMPGEIYSFGIVYVYKDGSVSPVYHIPGANTNEDTLMSKDNVLSSSYYLSKDTCNESSIWGVDSQGEELVGTKVRHHRFPLRSEIDETLYKRSGRILQNNIYRYEGYLDITGEFSEDFSEDSISIVINYTINNNPYQIQRTVLKESYNSDEGILDDLIITALNPIENIDIKEIDPITSLPVEPFSGLNYNTETKRIRDNTGYKDGIKYKTNIFGIKFSNIDLPETDEKIVGYYIVRNQRDEINTTILDSGVLCPLLEDNGKREFKVSSANTNTHGDYIDEDPEIKFVSHGHLMPNSDYINNNIYSIIHPQHKFNNREYTNVTDIIQEGVYKSTVKHIVKDSTEDVQAGTSYDPEVHRNSESDFNGFKLETLVRTNKIKYNKIEPIKYTQDDIKEIFYLDTLFSNTVDDVDDISRDVYNLSSDNKIGIVQFNKIKEYEGELPYVILKRNLSDPYSGFSILPYYRETTNPIFFNFTTKNETSIYNGDSYISSMKYMSSMFYEVKEKKRKGKSGIFQVILGALAVIVGVLIAVGTLGGGLMLSIYAIGLGVTQLSTGFKKEQMNKVYSELYKLGLKNTVEDNDTFEYFDSQKIDDDTIRWFHDKLEDLWFESKVNMNWRMGSNSGITDFMDAPEGYSEEQSLKYAINKVTTPDAENDDGKLYQGFAKAEIYDLNPDYTRREREKSHYALGLEYDCCSECQEDFPHRIQYSEQSFQEELTDNYRTFLSNNYRDISGETGEITDIFTIQNNIYLHTQEALWHLPQSLQERVNDDIVTFIGSGSYFELPPRKIIDDTNGNSAGCSHKWGTLKTPHGVFFISENQGIIYQFNGNNLEPISSNGNFNWFKNNIPLNNKFYDNNPMHPLGNGFISVYDSRKERIIITKKSYYLDNQNSNKIDTSWTYSYSLKYKSWQYFHSYLPNFYLHSPDKFYSWINTNNKLWKHNIKGFYQNYYEIKQPYIIEYVSNDAPITNKIWEYLTFITKAQEFNKNTNEFNEIRYVTFNKGLFYNSRQSTGILNLVVQDNNEDYLMDRIKDLDGDSIYISKDEFNWHINEIRNNRINYNRSMFTSNKGDLQDNYYIDKNINSNTIDYSKDWTQAELLRDKYMIIRLIFEDYDNIKLSLNYSIESEQQSFR